MAVEYRSSTVTNMEAEKNKIGFQKLTMEDSKLSVYRLRNNPFRVAVCLGLLCVLLLAGIIGQSVYYRKVEQEHQNELKAMTKEKETINDNLKTVRIEKKNEEAVRQQIQQTSDYAVRTRDRLQINNNLLTEERNQLKASHSQLQAENTALTKQTENLKASRDRLQASNNVLSEAKVLLQKQRDSAVSRRTGLEANLDSVTKERDNLQNKLNNVTRSREQMQASYNTLIKDVERLHDRYNFSSKEKDKIASSHQNLTMEKDTLQANYNILRKATDELQASCASLDREKTEMESNCKIITMDRDLLKTKNYNLTAEIDRLNATIQDRKCPSGWQKFQASCYYASVGKKTWSLSREHCQNKGADLATIKSQEEMTFINDLYSSDKEVWIGLTDGGIEGDWKWADGTPLTTAFWGKGQPNSYDGRNQDCVEFWHRATGNGEWNDENCNLEQNWICKM